MDCEKVFVDFPNTNRLDLQALVEKGGLMDGDTLCIFGKSELGRGGEAARIWKMVEELGVTIEIVEGLKKKAPLGRKARLKPTPEQKVHLCALWESPAPQKHVLVRASEVMGGPVNRNHMNYWCGPRSNPKKG
jgi:hypothetical protein